MSDVQDSNVRDLRPVPSPQPLTGLTGAPAAIYTELVTTPYATAAELALAAGLGRSTATNALATLEKQGLVVREPGGHEGARRVPDRWRAAGDSPLATGDDDAAANHDSDTTRTGDRPEPAPTSPTKVDANGTGTTSESPSTTLGEQTVHPEAPSDGGQPVAESAATTSFGEGKRLAPGALRQLVVGHLEAHPGKAFTATGISRAISKSSGAIANALVTLAGQGVAEQVTDRPRTYRLANPSGTESE
ncbi:helix-turn-helix domain-containing protein [Streptomyces monticola]|uniref:Helix-turn-helix domain-containing protein n=1 Tax=Streptomyces monticola TaxID=2666263 RepID=A0ABW2JGG4_9ACTN